MQHRISEHYEQLAASLHRLMAGYGYERLETPVIQPAELFLTRAGDAIISRLFTFERGGKQLALRPEYTSTALALFCAQNALPVARWQFGGLVFEDSPDAPHQQRLSIGAEVFGLPEPLADAEIIEMSLRGMHEAGVADARVVIGHVGLLRLLVGQHVREPRLQRLLLNQIHLLRRPDGEAQVREQLDQMMGTAISGGTGANHSPSAVVMEALLQPLEQAQLMGGRTREDIQRRLTRKLERAEARPQIEAALAVIKALLSLEGPRAVVFPELRALAAANPEALALLDEWEGILDLAMTLGVHEQLITVAPGLSRNWDYYSGMVFELHSGTIHLGGGGRYDELARLLGSAAPVSAVGFAYYVDEILAVLPPPVQTALISLSGQPGSMHLAAWLNALRGAGLRVALLPTDGNWQVDETGRLHAEDGFYMLADAARVAETLGGAQ